jgi:cathepsin L
MATPLILLLLAVTTARGGFFDNLPGGVETLDAEELLGAKGMLGGLKLTVPKGMGMGANAASKLASALSLPGVADAAYKKFNEQFSPDTKSDSSNERKGIFKTNLKQILEHNVMKKYGESSSTYTKGVNKFSAMTLKEVLKKYTNGGQPIGNGTFGQSTSSVPTKMPPGVNTRGGRGKGKREAPASRDWRQYGIVTSVKNQEDCGSCTLFACTAVIEANMALYKGQDQRYKDLDLSEQELLDCPSGNGVAHCQGNWPPPIYDYVKENGQTTEAEYPYTKRQGTCQADDKSKVGSVSGYWQINSGDETQLRDWVAKYGVHSVVITVEDGFYQYRGGVMNTQCKNKSYDHSVTVVGYGTDDKEGDYWIVKNSWGPGWGEQGYIRMGRNKDNLCLIASMAYLAQP